MGEGGQGGSKRGGCGGGMWATMQGKGSISTRNPKVQQLASAAIRTGYEMHTKMYRVCEKYLLSRQGQFGLALHSCSIGRCSLGLQVCKATSQPAEQDVYVCSRPLQPAYITHTYIKSIILPLVGLESCSMV